MSQKHANISVFVPHIGCPNRCSFCDQRSITGSHKAPGPQDVEEAVNIAKKSAHFDPVNTEIAFFGGSFTAINRNYMLCLLKTASRFVEEGVVCGIRISTRPDAIDDEILSILKEHHVTAIELGAQSLDNTVLKMNNRGHSVKDVEKATLKIKEYGFSVGLQMMTGLYGDSDEKSIKTAEKIIKLKPDTVRIYPTIVLKNTDLAALYADHIYSPQTIENAVSLCSKLLVMFKNASIPVIRLGLHSIEQDSFVAGPWHPAFSELCISEIYLNTAIEQLKEKGDYNIYVNPSSVSKMVGQKKKNIITLSQMGFNCRVLTDSSLNEYQIITERLENICC
ncbi:MAG: radical SAM protein [Ruminococcaceae bacterium]|nr:radical SAM protein [Oscillospiraceae bacterium]